MGLCIGSSEAPLHDSATPLAALFTELPGCLVGIEVYATAHDWEREIAKLRRLDRPRSR